MFTSERVDRQHAALAVRLGLNGLRVSEACDATIDDLGFDRGHRTLRIIGKGNKPAVIPLVPRTARTVDLAIGERRDGPILVRRDVPDSSSAQRTGGSDRSANAQVLDTSTRTCSVARSSWRRSMPAFRCVRCNSLPATLPRAHDHLRPAPREVRPPCRVRRGRVRRWRLTHRSAFGLDLRPIFVIRLIGGVSSISSPTRHHHRRRDPRRRPCAGIRRHGPRR